MQHACIESPILNSPLLPVFSAHLFFLETRWQRQRVDWLPGALVRR